VGKGKRNRERRSKEQAPRAEMRISGSDAARELMQRRIERGAALISEIPTPADLPPAIEKRIAAVEEALEEYDALHILANFCFANLPTHPDTYVESEEEASAAQVELLTAILLRRPSREGKAERLLPIGKAIHDAVREPLQELLNLLMFDGFSGALKGARDVKEAWVRARSAGHSLHLHAPGFHWQQKAMLKGLFGPEQIAADLRAALGFDVDVALACTEALEDLVNDHFAAQGERSFSAAEMAKRGEQNEATEWVKATFNGDEFSNDQIAALVLGVWTFHDWGEVLSFSVSEMAERAQVNEEEAGGYLEALAIGFGEIDPRLRTGVEEARMHPFIRIGDGRYQPSFPGNALWALRPLFETTLKKASTKAWRRYQTHRGRWVEKRAADLLGGVLRPDLLKTGVNYEGTVEGKTIKGEIDGLVRLGDTLIVIEAKGATIGGRRGGEKLIDQLQKVLTKAATQASAAKQALETDDEIALHDSKGKTVELGIDHAREIHPVVVTLDDLSVVAPNLWELEGSRLLPEGITAPWVINLHELELICGLVERPVQLVHFLRRRSRLNQLGGRVASDELDWWMLYLQSSLYMEEEGEPPHQVRYASLTDPLDAYYFYLHEERNEEAPKPKQALDTPSVELLAFLDEHRPPAFVAAACDLLDISGESRQKFLSDLAAKRSIAVERNRPQRGTYVITKNQPGGLLIGFVAAPDGEGKHLPAYLRQFAEERLSEHDAERLVVLGVEASSPRPLDALVVVEPRVWRLPTPDSVSVN
jgi:hypothetical protein